MTNAMKYSGDSRDLGIVLSAESGNALIRVADHGYGIAPEEQRSIFEKFYRTPSEQNRSIPGTGLGLTIVAHAVKAHGGRVQVDSAVGQESTFTICLPLESRA